MTRKKSDEIDTIAYAVSYYEAADLIARSTDWTDNHGLVVPFFALIGFSLENGLKAVLEFRKIEPQKSWFHSHDLLKLRDLVQAQGLPIRPHVDDLLQQLAVPHLEHHFRYPQKATKLALLKPPSAAVITDDLLRRFSFISTGRIGDRVSCPSMFSITAPRPDEPIRKA